MAVARLVMGEWGEKMRQTMTDTNIKIFLDGLFVDDCRFLTSSLPLGVRWSQEERNFIFREDWKKGDIDEQMNNLQRMNEHQKSYVKQ